MLSLPFICALIRPGRHQGRPLEITSYSWQGTRGRPDTNAVMPPTDFISLIALRLARLRYQYSTSTSIYLKAELHGKTAGYVVWDDPDSATSHKLDGIVSREVYYDKADMTLFRSMGKEHDSAESEVIGKHWYLSGIVVAKGFQGMGVGSALLNWGLSRADKLGLEVFCLSSEEVSTAHRIPVSPSLLFYFSLPAVRSVGH
jgi:GNAT superfamily N-acetyltransferase